MAQSIEDSVRQVRKIVRNIGGIRSAPAGVPENDQGIYPFFVAWNGGGDIATRDNSFQTGLWTITGQLHFSRADLFRAEEFASKFPELIVNELLSQTNYNLGGYCETFGNIVVSNFRPMAWGDIQTIGYEFTINRVKINKTRNT